MGRRQEKNMKKGNSVELLAPAGSLASMEAAIGSGADAVYMGGPLFGARAYADNPQPEGVVRALDYVHTRGKRLYLTVNTLFKKEDLAGLYDYLLPFYEAGLDAVLVQDLGVLRQLRRDFPDLPVHASTQMTVMDADGALALAKLGVSRVVTARELTLEEMRAIADTGVELEVFVHGAICYCYSGQCLLSSLIGGRSGNRGRCAQPCRLPYEAREKGRTLTKAGQNYVLSLKDMDTLSCLPLLLEAGAASLKIEGRMKSPRYTGGVTAVYRKYIDRYMAGGEYRVEPEDRRFLRELFDRGGYTEYASRGLHDGMVAVGQKPQQRPVDEPFLKKKEEELAGTASKEKIKGKLRFFAGEPVIITIEKKAGASDRTEAGVSVTESGPAVQPAQNRPLDEAALRERFSRLGDTDLEWERLEVETDGAGFLPAGQLNELRRRAVEALERESLRRYRRSAPARVALEGGASSGSGLNGDAPGAGKRGEGPACGASGAGGPIPEIYAAVNTPAQLALLSEYPGIARIYLNLSTLTEAQEEEALRWFAGKYGLQSGAESVPALYLNLPPVLRGSMKEALAPRLSLHERLGVGGYLVHTWDQAAWLRRVRPGACLQADASLYTWNREAVRTLKDLGIQGTTLPVELNSRELRERTRGSALPDELIAYGYLPVMVSAQCVRRTVSGCTGRPGLLELKDRKQKRFAVQSHCRFCFNTIYNSEPLFLLDCRREWERLSLQALRLQFTIETEKEMRRVLDGCLADLRAGRPVENPLEHFTRGHFRRGVE